MRASFLEEKSCPLPVAGTRGKILTRIFIEETGDLIVTDLWEEIRRVLEGTAEKAGPKTDSEEAR